MSRIQRYSAAGSVQTIAKHVAGPGVNHRGGRPHVHPVQGQRLKAVLLVKTEHQRGKGHTGIAALRYADRLEGLDAPSHARTLPGDLALSIRAQVGRISGEPAEALRALERIRMETWYQLTSVSAFHSRAYERYMRAELLNLLGREDDALRWYSSFTHSGPQDLIYLAPSHLGRADIYRRQGRNEEAARHYRRFLELWKDCDPVLRPLVSDAEVRLRRLTEGTASQ